MKKCALQGLVVAALIFGLSACLFNREKKDTFHRVPYQLTDKSPLFNDDNFELIIDSAGNYLHIKLKGKAGLKKFPYPKDDQGNLLSSTAFSFSILNNKLPLTGASLTNFHDVRYSYFGYNRWLGQTVTHSTDTSDLSRGFVAEFKIPFYAFNKLKTGIHELELRGIQNVFCSQANFETLRIDSASKDTTLKYVRHYSPSVLIAFSVKFKVQVPQIFRTTLYGYGIELRNDSVFSPAGMDNTLWKSSYPDIYWTVDYPCNNFYCSSDYQKSTSHYDEQDTFYLYHYTPYDSIAIGVWDHDNLSRDDYISYQNFSLQQLPAGKKTILKFDNIKAFEIKAEKGYAVNR